MAFNLSKIYEEEEEKKRKQQQQIMNQNYYTDSNGFYLRRDANPMKLHEAVKQGQSQLNEKAKEIEKARQAEEESSGYHFGDVTKGIINFGGNVLATGTDLALDILEGGLSYAEGGIDTLAYFGADALDIVGAGDLASDLRSRADFNSTAQIFGKNPNVQQNFGNWTQGIEEASWSPDYIDQIAQGIGQIGTAGLTAAATGGGSLASAGVTFASSYGNARSEAKRNGASDADAHRAGLIGGFAETISEQFFSGIPGMKVEGWGDKLTGKIADKVTKYFGTKTGKIALKAMDSLGEGSEEIISNILNAALTDIGHAINNEYTYGMENMSGNILEDTWDQLWSSDSWGQFLSAALSSAIVNGGKAVFDTKTQNKIINAYAQDNGMSFADAKYILTGQLDTAKKVLTDREKVDYDSQVELEDMAKQRVLNYMQQTTGLNAEQNINEQIANQELIEGREFTDAEKEQMAKGIRSKEEDKINNPERYRSFTQNSTDEREKALEQSMVDVGFNDTKIHHKLFDFVSKLMKANPNSRYRFVNNQQLVEMGLLENNNGVYGQTIMKDGLPVFQKNTIQGLNNGSEILINADLMNQKTANGEYRFKNDEEVQKFYKTIIGHEMGEAIKNESLKNKTDDYDNLKKLVKEVFGEGDLENYKQRYGENLTDNVEDEYINDKLGELFDNDTLIDKIADNRNLLQKFIDQIKRITSYITSSKEKKQMMQLQEKLENKFVEKYKEASFTGDKAAYSVIGEVGLNNLQEYVNNASNVDEKTKRLVNTFSNSLETAKERYKQGKDRTEIYNGTYWYNENGKWKIELSNEDLEMHLPKKIKINQEYNLGNIIGNDILTIAYPELNETKFIVRNFDKKGLSKIIAQWRGNKIENKAKLGYFSPTENSINVNKHNLLNDNNKLVVTDKAKSNLVHEIQHIIQKIEGFERGANRALGGLRYANNNGEAEARTASERMNLPQAEISQNIPFYEEQKANKESKVSKYLSKDKGIIDKLRDGIYTKFKKYFSEDSNINYEEQSDEISSQNIQENMRDSGKQENRLDSSFSLQKYSLGEENTHKQQQLDLVLKNNPMTDDYHQGIRSIDDIKTFEEAINDDESFVWGDYTREDAERDLARNKVKVYSSYDIKNGTFVSTSYQQALEYAGRDASKVRSKEVNPNDVAWINGDEGQYAKVDNVKYSLTQDSNGKELSKDQQEYFKDSKVRDNEGRLLEVYHGTPNAGFTIYDSNRLGETTGADDTSLGFHLTDNEQLASFFSGVVGDEVYNEAKQEIYKKYNIDENENLPFEMGAKVNQEIADLAEEKAKQKGEVKHQYINITKPLSVFADYGIDESQLARDLVYAATGEEDISNVSDYYESNEEFLSAIQQNFDNELAQLKDELAKPESIERIKEMGYDGLILPMTNTDKATIKGTGNEYVVFNSNQIKNTDNSNPTENQDIRYSLSHDSQDRELSPQQQEYFKDSKVRDAEGRLIPMYHGTSGEFNEFDRDLAGRHGTYFGAGFYFTPDIDSARDYAKMNAGEQGRVVESYLNMTNPYIPSTDVINSDGSVTFAPSFYEDFENRFKDSLPAYWNDDLTNAQRGKVVRNVLEDNGYDGVINGDTYVVFESNQIKNVDNSNPTSSPDIRYSLSVQEANTGTDNSGNQLSQGQKDYFKDSKVTDESGNLIEVYHTTTDYTNQFNEFNPVGTPGYRYGDTAVNFYTDSKDMSSSYGYNSISPNTTRIEAMEDVNKVLGDRYRVEEKDGKYELYDNYEEKIVDNYNKFIKLFNQDQQDILTRTFNKSRGDLLNELSKEEFEFYDRTRRLFQNMLYVQDFSGILYNKVNRTFDEVIADYLENGKVSPYKTFNNQNDLFRNVTSVTSPYEHYQYNGYLNITNPYIVEGNGKNWNDILQGDNLKAKNMYELLTDDEKTEMTKLANLTNEMYDNFQDKYDAFYQRLLATNEQLYDKVTEDSSIREKLYTTALNNWDERNIGELLSKRNTTNDLVKQVLEMNENGANYDGVIFNNITDYGWHSAGMDDTQANNVYVTFNSNQFKAADNTNPTEDQDIRYKLGEQQDENLPYLLDRKIEDYKGFVDSINKYNLPTETKVEQQPEKEETFGTLTEEDYKNKKRELIDKYVDRAASKIEEQVKEVARRNLALKNKDIADLRNIIGAYNEMSREDIYSSDAKDVLRQFVEDHSHQEYEEQLINDEIRDMQKDIRAREFIISSDYKEEFPDGLTKFKKNNPGINIKFGAKGNLDTQLQELADLYPGQIDANVTYGDIPYVLADLMKKEYKQTKMQEFNLNEEEIDNITNKMFYGLTNNAISDQDLDRYVTDIQDKIRNKYARQMAIKNYRQEAKEMLDEIGLSNIKDKKRGLLYQVNTMKRNLRDIMSKESADKMYNTYFKPISIHNAQIENDLNNYYDRIDKYHINNEESTYAQMLGELKYNPVTTLTEQFVNDYLTKNRNKIDVSKVESAIEETRAVYDELMPRINEALIANGYKPIEYRQGYFPHFIEDKAGSVIGKFAEKLGFKVDKGQLPTDIAGITEEFVPGKAWTSFSQQRTGDATDYNLLKGLDNYLRGAMDIIYHTQDIQKLRALEAQMRYEYTDKGVREKIDEIFNNQELSNEEKYAQAALIVDNQKNNPLGNLVTELRNYTNSLANKKSISDRGMEQTMGRDMYSIMNNISSRVSANMVGANISSAMTNFIPITQAWSQVKTKNMLKAIYATIKSNIRDDGFSDKSIYLTNRTKQADRLFKTKLDKATQKLGIPFEAIDSFTSNVIVRAKYYENLENGMNEVEAMDNADEFAKDVMAGRSKGDSPTMFNKKNPITKLFTAFQLEVNNQYGYMFKDIKADIGKEAKDKIAMAFLKMFLGAFIYNQITEKITGRKAAFSPIDMAIDEAKIITNDNMDLATKLQNIAKDVAEEAPFLGGVLGGGRLPIQGAIPYGDPLSMITSTWENIGALADDEKRDAAINSLKKEWLKPVYYVALPVAGGQIKKTNEGLAMYNHELPGSYTDSGRLRFEADTSPLGKLQAAVFGQYASGNAREYFNEGYAPLTENQVDEAMEANLPITEYREIKKGLTKATKVAKKEGTSQAEAKVDYIYNLPLNDDQKNVLVNTALKRKEDIDISNYGDYSSLEEFDYANKNPQKYDTIRQVANYNVYNVYKDNIQKIKQEHAYTSTRRKAIEDYINSLPLNYYQKLILQKEAAGYSIEKYEVELYNYINGLDISAKEKKNIHKELFG